jgi:hypothetical protein
MLNQHQRSPCSRSSGRYRCVRRPFIAIPRCDTDPQRALRQSSGEPQRIWAFSSYRWSVPAHHPRLSGREHGMSGASDNSPSLKGRGFYGLAPTLCCPTATRLVSLNTAEVACAATARRATTMSKVRSCFYPWERFTTEPANTLLLARCIHAVEHTEYSPASEAACIPSPKGAGPSAAGEGKDARR